MVQFLDTISALCDLAGPSGEEDRVQRWCADQWVRLGAQVSRTPVGNVVARVGGVGPRLLIMAHADEIGLVVKSVTDNGLLHVWPGNRDTRGRPGPWHNPINNPVVLLADHGDVDGQLVYASGHTRGGSTAEHFEWNDWFIDIGASSPEQVAGRGIHPGTRAVAATRTRRVGDAIIGKAMDDRALLAVMTALLASVDLSRLRYELWFASTVMEENGMAAAAGIADVARFRFCINLEVGLCGDVPGVSAVDFPSRLRGGPIIVHQDAAVNYSPRMARHLVGIADEAGIPVQQAVFQYYSTDGAELIRRGVETLLVTVPARYTHTPNEMVAEADCLACVSLLRALLYSAPMPE